MFPRDSRAEVEFVLLSGERGCEEHCCCLRGPGELLLGDASGLRVIGLSGELQRYEAPGKKKFVMMVKDAAVVGSCDENGQQVVTIYDLANEIVEYSVTLFRNGKPEYVSWILHVWGMLLVVSRTHSVFSMKEKDLPTKLHSLFEKHQYSLALRIAQQNQMDYNGILDIHRLWACGASVK